MDFLLFAVLAGSVLYFQSKRADGSEVISPWLDIKKNPCASKPNGWQLLYWPQDDQCYKIFQKGYPCPETMELTPAKGGVAECQCPPGTAQSPRDAVCHKLYHKEPCGPNQYFAPVAPDLRSLQRHRWGACIDLEPCEQGKVYWAKDGKCYDETSRGPCPNGLLLQNNEGVGECDCDNSTMSEFFWERSSTCYEHYTIGPCEKGQLFLPGGICGCDSSLKQYYPENGLCYALDTIGPCKEGHKFVLDSDDNSEAIDGYARCICKEGFILWEEDGRCYRPYTRGPCEEGKMLEVTYNEDGYNMSCTAVPCQTAELFFLGGKGCHQVGTQGPCPENQIVMFLETTDSLSYLGVCGCQSFNTNRNPFFPTPLVHNPKIKCPATRKIDTEDSQMNAVNGTLSTEVQTTLQPNAPPSPTPTFPTTTEDPCGTKRGTVLWFDGTCQALYSQGPCKEGEWVVPDRGKGQRKGRGWKMGKCECRPGYAIKTIHDEIICQSPSVILAKFLSTNSHSKIEYES